MYVCSRMKLCSYLLKKGFRYEKTFKDKYNPNYNCWLFKNTPSLINAVNEYYLKKDRKKNNSNVN